MGSRRLRRRLGDEVASLLTCPPGRSRWLRAAWRPCSRGPVRRARWPTTVIAAGDADPWGAPTKETPGIRSISPIPATRSSTPRWLNGRHEAMPRHYAAGVVHPSAMSLLADQRDSHQRTMKLVDHWTLPGSEHFQPQIAIKDGPILSDGRVTVVDQDRFG